MKKIFKKLACCSFLLSIASIGYFDAEARLPKYMAQRAAELLIEKSGLKLKDEITKETFASNLVDFLYSTVKRQHLANWMKIAFSVAPKNKGEIKDEGIITDYPIYTEACNNLFNELVLQDVINKKDWITACNNSTFIKFANQHFPCWTGTLTCFMLNKTNKANIALLENNIVRICSNSINYLDPAKKIIGILFALELVDNWNDVKKITNTQEDAPIKHNEYDPYDCVPVPNTMYKIDKYKKWDTKNTQGSCMVSTIRNLLYILCRNSQKSTQITTSAMREDMQDAFVVTDFYTVPGITSCEALGEFARKILPGVTANYQPTLDLFICTLNNLLSENLRENIAMPTPKQYVSGSLGISTTAIKTILQRITNHTQLTVTAINNPNKVSSDWPESDLIINDKIVNKKITIAFGRRGAGHHIEIINIESAD